MYISTIKVLSVSVVKDTSLILFSIGFSRDHQPQHLCFWSGDTYRSTERTKSLHKPEVLMVGTSDSSYEWRVNQNGVLQSFLSFKSFRGFPTPFKTKSELLK